MTRSPDSPFTVPELRVLISTTEKKRKKLMDALLRCTTAEDQVPADTLRSVIEKLHQTLAALRASKSSIENYRPGHKAESVKLRVSDLRRFHLGVSLPRLEGDETIYITVEITRKPESMRLPIGHVIEVTAPDGSTKRTKAVKSINDAITFEYCFELGERNARNIESLRAADMTFRIRKMPRQQTPTYYSNRSPNEETVAVATAALSPLTFVLAATSPLYFMAMDGAKTQYRFDVRLSMSAPLVTLDDMDIDETIDVLRD